MNLFSIHTKLCLGPAALDQLTRLPIRRAFLVCDPFLVRAGTAGRVTDLLDGMGAEWRLFDQVTPNPTVELVSAGVEQILPFRPDTVISLGGGSAIDTGKAVTYIYAKQTGGTRPYSVAIPTTSGTGSEVTSFSVLTDQAAGCKYPLVDDSMLPDMALLDPSLTVSVPAKVTADTGLDVLTHAVEAYVATNANDLSDALAEKALALVLRHLPTAVKDGAHLDARTKLHNASCMAGAAFQNAGLGLCHGMSHALGELLHLPHGACNAMLLPHVMAFNAGLGEQGDFPAAGRYAALAQLAGCCCHSDAIAVAGLLRQIEGLMAQTGVARALAGTEARTKLEQSLDRLAAAALADRCTATTPRPATPEQVKAIYRRLLA